MPKRSDEPAPMFTRVHYDQLVRARRELSGLLSDLDKAEACGVNCATFREQRQNLDNQLAAIQQHFMTPPPKQ